MSELDAEEAAAAWARAEASGDTGAIDDARDHLASGDPAGSNAPPPAGPPTGPMVDSATARALVDRAETALDAAVDDLAAAEDAHADTDGTLRVAEAKAEAYATDPSRKEWERLAAAEAVEKARRAHDRAAGKVLRRRSRHDKAEQQLDAATEILRLAEQAAADQPAADAAGAEAKPMAFANVEQFVTRYLLEVTRRPGLQWCTTWWRHAEAVDRLRALWTSWEAMRWEGPTAMTVWWRDYCDPTVYALMKKDGTFASCDHSTDVHKQGRLLPTDQAPDGLLDEPEPEPGQGEN